MLTLDRPQDATHCQGEIAESVCVRVRPDGPVVELPVGKTTVGSSPRCGIRLQQPGVQPLHCLILRTSSEITARRWAGETTLNGERLLDAPIHPGDCLQVGPVQLEILGTENSIGETTPVLEVPSLPPLASTTALALPTLPPPPAATPQSSTDQKLLEARDLARDRGRRMLRALRRSRQACAELSGQSEQLAANNQQLQRRIESLNERVEQLVAEQEALTAAHHSVSGEKDSLEAEAQRASDEVWRLQEQLREHTDRCLALASERDEAASRSDSLHAELQLASEREAAALENTARLDTELAELRRLYDEQGMKLDAVTGEQAEKLRECETLRSDVQSLQARESSLQTELQQSHDESERLRSQLEELRKEHGSVGEQHDALRAELAAESENVGRLTREREKLTAECDRLRAAADRLPAVEQQLRSAISEKESTASELYRALLQLAQLEEESDHQAEMEAVNEAVNKELERSRTEIASLQSQIEQLATDRTEIAEKKSSLDARIAQLIDAHQQVAHERDELSTEVDALREQFEEARRQEAENITRLQQAEALQPRLDALESSQAELVDTVERLKSELAEKEQASAASAAEVQSLKTELDDVREKWQHEREQLSGRERELEQQIAELEGRLAEASAANDALASSIAAMMQENTATADEDSSELSPVDSPATEGPIAECGTPSAEAEIGNDRPVTTDAIDAKAEAKRQAEAIRALAPRSTWDGQPSQNTWSVTEGFVRRSSIVAGDAATTSFGGDATAEAEQDVVALDPMEAASGISSQPVHDDANSPSEAADETPIVEATSSQSTSFIERYAHLFAEDAGGSAPQPSPSIESRQDHEHVPMPAVVAATLGDGVAKPTSGKDDEESIEEYMAKLLQRVRGETAAAAPTVAKREPSADVPPAASTGDGFASGPLPAPLSMSCVENDSPVSLEAIRRKSPMIVPQTDLEALRALANESARRAISRHTVRKLRRNATTKVLVATLAGVTSLWFMLHADQWWDLQFVTACVSMLVAAIWTGETFRTLLQTLRVATSDETDEEIEQLAAELRAPLPIDIEPSEAWTTTAPEDGADAEA